MKNIIGISLFVLYFAQYFFDIKFDFLEQLQTGEMYKRWSGLVLFLLLLSQWYLSFKRVNKSLSNIRKEFYINIHKWIGVFLPIAFFFHSTNIGFGILFALSFLFFINIGMGFLNTKSLVEKHPKFFNSWLGIHIFLSVFIMFLAGIHIWQVFYYS